MTPHVWLAALLLIGCSPAPDPPRKPNLVLIIGDDHGYRDFGFMGSEIVRTPNLDQLAREGTLFRNAQVTASVCRPSLRSLLTGLHPYQWRLRIEQQQGRGIRRAPDLWIEEFRTLPGLLAEQGYVSLQAGKFWERSYAAAGFTHGMDNPKRGVSPIGRSTMRPVYEFIDAHTDRPFFLWFAPVLPHVPYDAPALYRAPYQDEGLSEGAIGYYANITRFDDVVRRLLDHLDRRGLRNTTLVAYIADNGIDQGPTATHLGLPGGGAKGKMSMHSLGFRSPLVLRWPDRVPAGVVRHALVSSVDLMPTLLDYAGAAPVPGLAGRSLRPLLEGEPYAAREFLVGSADRVRVSPDRPRLGDAPFWSKERAFFVHTRDWRYVWYADRGTEELYDLRADPEESHNAIASDPARAATLRARIVEWKREMRRPLDSP